MIPARSARHDKRSWPFLPQTAEFFRRLEYEQGLDVAAASLLPFLFGLFEALNPQS
jgi:hypothetical protein